MIKRFLALSMFAFAASGAFSGTPEVAHLQNRWAQIKYQQPKDKQEVQFKALLESSEQLADRVPNDPEVLTWYGIIESSYAGAKGGLGALKYVKHAKAMFEKAIELDDKVLDGSALTSLGSLYYQVPGWPIGFGSDQKALEYLKQGLAVNPGGIDSNFFYGDFLFRSGDYAGAKQALNKALQAPSRRGRASADEGRRAEIQQLLLEIARKK